MIRYVLSRYNTWRRCVRFPLFTFLVNVVGSIGLAFTTISIELRGYDLDTDVPGSVLHAFQGASLVSDPPPSRSFVIPPPNSALGCTGSLTTVSTFIGELYALPPVPFAYAYIIATLGMTQAALIPINGLYTWLQ